MNMNNGFIDFLYTTRYLHTPKDNRYKYCLLENFVNIIKHFNFLFACFIEQDVQGQGFMERIVHYLALSIARGKTVTFLMGHALFVLMDTQEPSAIKVKSFVFYKLQLVLERQFITYPFRMENSI